VDTTDGGESVKVKVDPTVTAMCIERAGWLKGARIAEFVTAWSIAENELGHDPTVEEFAKWWAGSKRAAYYRLADFREAFPEADTPRDLFRAQKETVRRRQPEAHQPTAGTARS
jgi:hypothetical protein